MYLRPSLHLRRIAPQSTSGCDLQPLKGEGANQGVPRLSSKSESLREKIYLRDNELNADFGYEETIAILRVATSDLGFRPKC